MHGLTSVHTGLESHTTEQARAWQLASIAPYLCCCWGNPRWWAATPGWLVDLCDCVTHTKHILPTNHTSRLLWDCRAYLYRAYRRHRHSVTKQGVLLCDVHPTDEAWVEAGTAFILRRVLVAARGGVLLRVLCRQAGSRLLYHYGTRVLRVPAAMRHQLCCCRSHSWLCCLGRYLLKCGMREATAGMCVRTAVKTKWPWGAGTAAGCVLSFVSCDGA